MGTFRNVSKAEACPICGKSDWCSILIPDNAAYPGQLLYVCRRIHSPEAQSPVNGKTYYYIKELPDSYAFILILRKEAGYLKSLLVTPIVPHRKPPPHQPTMGPFLCLTTIWI